MVQIVLSCVRDVHTGECVCVCVCARGVAPYYRGRSVRVCRWVREAGPCASENDTRGACTGALRVRHPHLGQSLCVCVCVQARVGVAVCARCSGPPAARLGSLTLRPTGGDGGRGQRAILPAPAPGHREGTGVGWMGWGGMRQLLRWDGVPMHPSCQGRDRYTAGPTRWWHPCRRGCLAGTHTDG